MRITIVYISLLLAAASLFAGGSGEQLLQVGYPQTVSSIPLMELVERYSEDYAGTSFTDHPQALGQLINGELGVLASGFSVGLTRFGAAGDIGHLDTYVWGVSAIMTAEPAESLADLAGSVLYVPFEGSPIDIQIRAQVAAEGLTGQIEIAFAPFPQAAALLAQGKAGGAVLVEPLAANLEISGRAHRLMNIQDSYALISGGETRSPQVSVFTRLEFFADNTRTVRQLLRRLEDIGAEIAADPQTFAAKYAPVFELPEAVILASLENTLYDFESPRTDRRLIEGYLEIMGLPIPADSFFLE
jgi:ABC-type nitrate/sulfonate/bicarbonate transport system substrate-binding protein